MPIHSQWLLYGANGYTGELIARQAVQQGLQPILAGRSAAVRALAQTLGLQARVFSLDDQTATVRALEDVALVLNCAGPFAHTAGRMMQACLAQHAHYLDITGEIAVFELAHSLHEKAERARSVLCPGVGFDVVPTDCVAACLREALPDATALALAFELRGSASRGTAKTVVEMLGMGGRVRKDGVLTQVPFDHRTREIDLGDGLRDAACIPWGDVSTAFYTTGIGNIEVYMSGVPGMSERLRQADRWSWLLRHPWVQRMAKYKIGKGPPGPTQTERDQSGVWVWGEVTNATHQRRVARMHTANGYVVTVHAALAVVERLLAGATVAGYFTPAKLMGARFAETLPNSSPIRIQEA